MRFKKTIAFSLVAIAATIFACSKKNDSFCWKCMTTVTYSPSSAGGSGSSSSTMCNQTEDQIRQVEKAGTSTSTGSYGGYTTTIKTTTHCTKQ
jgi:hypothetical protein